MNTGEGRVRDNFIYSCSEQLRNMASYFQEKPQLEMSANKALRNTRGPRHEVIKDWIIPYDDESFGKHVVRPKTCKMKEAI